MVPSLVGSKRLREDFEDDLAQIRVDDLRFYLSVQFGPYDCVYAHCRILFYKPCLDKKAQTPGSTSLWR